MPHPIAERLLEIIMHRAGRIVVTLLCDNGAKYQSRLFNRKWLAEKGFLEAAGFTQSQQVLQPIAITEYPRVVDGYPQRLSA